MDNQTLKTGAFIRTIQTSSVASGNNGGTGAGRGVNISMYYGFNKCCPSTQNEDCQQADRGQERVARSDQLGRENDGGGMYVRIC